MRRFLVGAGAALAVIVVSVAGVSAHTPLWKPGLITSLRTALVFPNGVYTYSAYRYLRTQDQIDYFSVAAQQGTDLNPEIDVAAWPTLTHFNPSLAIIGPGLPPPTGPVSFSIPPGDGAVVLTYTGPWPPVSWYEPFGGTALYYDVRQHFVVPGTGTYYLAVFAGQGNDPLVGPYVLSIGTIEHVQVAPNTRCLVQAWYHNRPEWTCLGPSGGDVNGSSGLVAR